MKNGTLVFYGYDKCSTCRDAEKALRAKDISFEKVAIVDSPPDQAAFRRWMQANDLPIKRWVNTSGQSYRALVAARGKEAVDALGADEWAALLSEDGKLVKRPLLASGDRVIVGFDREAYASLS